MKSRVSRPRRLVHAAVLATAGLVAGPAVYAQVPVPTAPPTAAAPSCLTADTSGQPATLFGPGDRFVVKGEGFGLVSAIRITFVQGTRTLPIGIAYSDELGVFSTDKVPLRMPDTAQPGPASIHTFSTTKVATCAVQVMAAAGGSAAAPKPHKKRSLLVLVWWVVLGVFGLFLIVVLVRRWRAQRLARSARAPAAPPAVVDQPPGELDDLPVLEERPPPLAPEPEPVAPLPPLAPILDEPFPRRTESLGQEAPVLDLMPDPEAEPELGPEPETQLPPLAPSAPKPDGGDDLDEFVFRDGKWRLRDDLEASAAGLDRPFGVDVGDAKAVADALAVPQAGHRPPGEPPLLDPELSSDSDDAPMEGPARPSVTPPVPVEGAVSDTVARLVENTKDWTKR